MAGAKYVITAADLRAARAYLQRKLALEPFWLEPPQAHDHFPQQSRDPVTLNQWCERWLDQRQWQQLKAAVRAARKRQRQQVGNEGPPVHVTLSRPAWSVLADLAKHDGVTLSEFILRQHYQAWLALETPETGAA